MFFFGVMAGIGAAFFQDAGYVCSRIFVARGGKPSVLLTGTQIVMGVAGVGILLVLLGSGVTAQWHWRVTLPLCGSAFGSLFGQLFFFRAEKTVEPPKLSSLMGLRVILISIITSLFFGEHYNFWQILAVIMAAASAFLLNWEKGHFSRQGLGMVLLSLFSYSISDISVMKLVRGLGCGGMLSSSLMAMALVNILLSMTMLPLLRRQARENNIPVRRVLAGAVPFSSVWLGKQLLLYMCYGWIGPVFGNVIMSLRGPIALALGWVMRKLHLRAAAVAGGHGGWQQLAAVFLMTLAIVIYSLA